jgi:hypothetical protein
MTYHEKSRWIAFLANLLVWGWYFAILARALSAGYPDEPHLLALAVPAVLAITVINIVAHVAVAILKPKEARTSLDERERDIARRATSIAYHIFSVAVFGVFVIAFWTWNVFVTINAVLFAFILAESARYLIEIIAYRRGLA